MNSYESVTMMLDGTGMMAKHQSLTVPLLGDQGLEDGMLGMKKSGRRLLIIPPSLAYGSKGAANHALASSTLIFEAELCRVLFTIFHYVFFFSSDKHEIIRF